MTHLRQDVTYAFRAIRRTPVFAVIAILIMTLGIGGTVATFTIIDAVYFRPLPFANPTELFAIRQQTNKAECSKGCAVPLSSIQLSQWSSETNHLADLAAALDYGGVLSTSSGASYTVGAAVSANFLSLLGFKAAVGRGLTAGDDLAGSPPVMVLSHHFWRETFGSDPHVIGSSVRLNGEVYQIVGILPPEATVGEPLIPTDDPTIPFFVAANRLLAAHPEVAVPLQLIARLKTAGTEPSLAHQAEALLHGVSDRTPGENPRVVVASVRSLYSDRFGSSYPIFLGATVFVAFVACVNLGGLFLARLTARRREILIRTTLGAQRGQLVRQFTIEAMLLAGAGGALGLALVWRAIGLARHLPIQAVPYWTSFTIDGRVVLFTLIVSCLGAVIFGLGPAFVLTKAEGQLSAPELPGSTRVPGIQLRRYLISIQVALTVLLLIGTGLLGKTFLEAARRDTGMVQHSLVTGLLDTSGPEFQTRAKQHQVADELLRRLALLPGAAGAAVRGMATERHPDGMTRDVDSMPTPAGIAPTAANVVSPGYFAINGVAVLQGREFSPLDDTGAPPVALLDEATAKRLFPEGAIGRRIKFGAPSSAEPWLTIVGVVAGMNRQITTAKLSPYNPILFRPIGQVPTLPLRFAVRTSGSSETLVPVVRNALRDFLPEAPVAGLTTIEAYRDSQLAPLRINAVVLGAFAVVAAIMAVLGTYGLIAFLVERQAVANAIRMALGAKRTDVAVLNLRAAAQMTAIGVVAGILGALALTRMLQSFIYDTSPTDPAVFIGAIVLVTVSALMAGFVPAWRAAGRDPAGLLRQL